MAVTSLLLEIERENALTFCVGAPLYARCLPLSCFSDGPLDEVLSKMKRIYQSKTVNTYNKVLSPFSLSHLRILLKTTTEPFGEGASAHTRWQPVHFATGQPYCCENRLRSGITSSRVVSIVVDCDYDYGNDRV